MHRFVAKRAGSTRWAAAILGAGLLLVSCGSSQSDSGSPTPVSNDHPGASSGGPGSSPPGSSGGVATSDSDASLGDDGGGSGVSPGDSGGSDASSDGSIGDAATGGGDAAVDASVGGDCQVGDITPCSSFTTPIGTTIQLGPYGAQMDVNVGAGFANQIQSGDMAGSTTCQGFVNLFNQDPNLSAKLLQTSVNGITIDFSLYSVYRPAVWPAGPVPVITWGNGTCAQPEGYGALLRYVASYGYFVIAANSRWVSSGTPAPMINALNYAASANMDSTSPYYQKLDMTKVGAMGHSQGGQATQSAANSDSRILYAIDFNAEDSNISKPYLAFSGDQDITLFTAQSMASAIDAATVPAAYLYYYHPIGTGPDGGGNIDGHLVLMLTPERVTEPTKDWWEMWFRADAASHAMFVGSSCGLCTDPGDYAYGANSLLK
jgi:hypothetical protein